MKITLTKVIRKEEVSQKTGNKYTRLAVRSQEHGERWLSGFGNFSNQNWKEGDLVDVEITEATAKDKEGRPYLNFRSVSKLELLEKRVLALEAIVLNSDKQSASDEPEEIGEEEQLPW